MNTTVGGDSLSVSSSYYADSYWSDFSAQNVFDGNLNTEYRNYGMCNYNFTAVSCGEKTGFYVTMQSRPKILVAFYLGTNNLIVMRDPLLITIEGSNSNESALIFGSSWTVIYSGPSGLMANPGRTKLGVMQILTNPSMPFTSYQLLITSKRDVGNAASYSEVQFIFSQHMHL